MYRVQSDLTTTRFTARLGTVRSTKSMLSGNFQQRYKPAPSMHRTFRSVIDLAPYTPGRDKWHGPAAGPNLTASFFKLLRPSVYLVIVIIESHKLSWNISSCTKLHKNNKSILSSRAYLLKSWSHHVSGSSA